MLLFVAALIAGADASDRAVDAAAAKFCDGSISCEPYFRSRRDRLAGYANSTESGDLVTAAIAENRHGDLVDWDKAYDRFRALRLARLPNHSDYPMSATMNAPAATTCRTTANTYYGRYSSNSSMTTTCN